MLRLVLMFLILISAPIHADDDIFAKQGDEVLLQVELDAAFAGIPEADRLTFIRDGGRVDQLVQNLLQTRQIAAAARADGFDDDPVIASRLALVAERELAKIWLEHVMANAPEADYAALAKEYYLGHPEEFMYPEMRDVSHILISTETRSEEEAQAIIADIETRLSEDPARFDDLVEEFSEDPARVNNKGRYPQMKRGDMVKPFEDAAFALEGEGQISAPVKTSYGYHVIRLNRRIPSAPVPFDEVKEQLMAQARERHLAEYRKRYIVSLTEDPIEIPDGAVETMAKRYFGENFELAPDYYGSKGD
jgi:peptidyl-prolyl cis-trans isomerase C